MLYDVWVLFDGMFVGGLLRSDTVDSRSPLAWKLRLGWGLLWLCDCQRGTLLSIENLLVQLGSGNPTYSTSLPLYRPKAARRGQPHLAALCPKPHYPICKYWQQLHIENNREIPIKLRIASKTEKQVKTPDISFVA